MNHPTGLFQQDLGNKKAQSHAFMLIQAPLGADIGFIQGMVAGPLFDATLAPSGMRSTQFTVLIGLGLVDSATISELAEMLAIDRTTMSRTLKPLLKKGYVGYIASKGVPMATLVAALTIVVELGGGLAVLFGFFARWAALVLAVFSVLAGILFHNYWALPADQVMNMQIHFWKNVSIAGGFLMLAAFGPGSISLDAKRGS